MQGQSDGADEDLRALTHAVVKVFAVVMAISFAVNLLLLASPIYMLQVYDRVLPTGHTNTLLFLTIIIAIALAVLAAFDSMRLWILSRLSQWLGDQVGPRVFAASLGVEPVDAYRGARPLRDVRQVQSFIGSQSILPFFDAPWAPFFFIVLWLLHWWLGVIALVAGIILLTLSILNEKLTRKTIQKSNNAQSVSFGLVDAYSRNFEVVRAMGMVPGLISHWSKVEKHAAASQGVSTELGSVFAGLSKFVRLLAQTAILCFGALLVLQGKLSAGSMIAGSILMGRALAPIEQALTTWRGFVGARDSYKRFRDFWIAKCTEADQPLELPEPKGDLSVENLTFAAQPGCPCPFCCSQFEVVFLNWKRRQECQANGIRRKMLSAN